MDPYSQMLASALGPSMAGAPSSATSSSGGGLDSFRSGDVSMGGGVHIGAKGIDLNSPMTWAVGVLLAIVVLQAVKK